MVFIKFNKYLLIIALILINVTIFFILVIPPVIEYELSIYNIYPSYFWYLIIINNTFGIYILFKQAFSHKRNNDWLIGLFIIIFSNSLFLSLPYVHGYALFPGGDSQTHIGYIKDIFSTGHIYYIDIYPLIHLLGVDILLFTGLSYESIITIIFILWGNLFLLSIYILSKKISNSFGQSLLITAFASPLIFSQFQMVVHPSMFSIFMVILILFFYFIIQKKSTKKISSYLLVILISLSITITHPVTCLFTIILIITYNISVYIYPIIINHKINIKKMHIKLEDFSIPFILLIAFFIWYINFTAINYSINNFYKFLVYGNEKSLFFSQIESLELSQITLTQALNLFINRYGSIFIYIILSIIAILIVIKNISFDKNYYIGFIYSILFIISLTVSLFTLLGYTGEYEPVRISRFFLMISPITIGFNFYAFIIDKNQKFNKPKITKSLLKIITFVLLIITNFLCVFSVYGSPQTVQRNGQITKTEILGTKWFSVHQYPSIITREIGIDLSRFEDYNFGVNLTLLVKSSIDSNMVPSHFGYDKNQSISATFNYQQQYILTCESDRINIMIYPENVREIVHNYSINDFIKLSNDKDVNRLYSNKGFEAWLVNS